MNSINDKNYMDAQKRGNNKFAFVGHINQLLEYVKKRFENLPDTRAYKVYTALLTQTGTDAPVAIVLENTLGEITFGYISVGSYEVISDGLFVLNKTAWLSSQNYINIGNEITYINYGDANTLYIDTIEDTTGTNGMLVNSTIEIRVYN